jgi:anaerobic magnesium-protoporphyrin IX monomethyl ester cyclase
LQIKRKGNNMSEILLLHPREDERIFGGMPPLGLAWIASYLESKGYAVNLIDMQIDSRTPEEIITGLKPKVVGIAGTSHTRYASFDIARTVKKIDDKVFTVYGGSHATFTAEDTLRHIPEIDAVVRGEGEETMFEVMETVLRGRNSLDDIEGVSRRKNGDIVHNPSRKRIQDLDALPFPARDMADLKKYDLKMDFLDIPAASVMSSRGCPVNCSYCSASAMFGRTLTLRSAKNIMDEIEILIKDFNVEGIKFFDSTLTLRKSHIHSLCDEILERGLKFPWECEIRVNTVNRDLLAKMKKAGCYFVDFGVESASPKVLKKMHKAISIDQVIDVFKWTKELDIYTKVFFTFGHIQETLEDAVITMDFIDKYRDYIISQGGGVGIKIYPGTLVEKYAYEIGRLDETFSWTAPYYDEQAEFFGGAPHVPLLIQSQMGYEELRQLRYMLIKRKLKNPFQLFRAVKDAWEKDNLRKVWTTAKGVIQAKLSR